MEDIHRRVALLEIKDELMGDEPEEVLRHVASRIKHRAKEAKKDD
ncbi:hypothetical protein [Mitsuokella multacida]